MRYGRRAISNQPIELSRLDTPYAMLRYSPGYGLFLHRLIDIKTRVAAEEYVRVANKAGKTINHPKGYLIDLREVLKPIVSKINNQ